MVAFLVSRPPPWMVAAIVIVRNLLCNLVYPSLITLIRDDWLSGMAILPLLVCLILNILAPIDDVLCVV